MARRPVAMQCWPSARGGQGLQQRGSPDPQEQARPSSGSWPRPQGPPAGRQHRHPLRRWTVPTPLSWWPSRHHRNMLQPLGQDAPGHVQPQGESPAPGPSSPYPNPRPDLPDRRQHVAVSRPGVRIAQATRARRRPGCGPQGGQAVGCRVAALARGGAAGLGCSAGFSSDFDIVPKGGCDGYDQWFHAILRVADAACNGRVGHSDDGHTPPRLPAANRPHG